LTLNKTSRALEVAKQRSWVATFALVALIPVTANAEMSAEELAKLAQNLFGNLISLPFQNNTNLNFGPDNADNCVFTGSLPRWFSEQFVIPVVVGSSPISPPAY
jgi:hypothetical protein